MTRKTQAVIYLPVLNGKKNTYKKKNFPAIQGLQHYQPLALGIFLKTYIKKKGRKFIGSSK